MKTILLMFDSLNRHYLEPYGNSWVHTPNFERLAKRASIWTQHYVGSSPCMPARRDLHTGRVNFLHRSWGPMEPYDESMPSNLASNGIYSHLVTDHYHYWEDGGATYHTRYNSWEFCRGQEGDPWIGQVDDPEIDPMAIGRKNASWRQDWINRSHIKEESQFPLAKTFNRAFEFLDINRDSDRWYLQIEAFDPHEPFFVPQRYLDFYPHEYHGPHFDWPPYREVEEPESYVHHMRNLYAALVTMCDAYLGRLLDYMDRFDMWSDTALIVTTDHGFLLGEHGWWAKNFPPLYQEIAHIPLFYWDPRVPSNGERVQAVSQMIDVSATIYDLFDLDPPVDSIGQPLGQIQSGRANRENACIFGIFGGHVNITDGRYVYMRSPVRSSNVPLNNYTLMPTHINRFFSRDELLQAEYCGPFEFTSGLKVMRIPAKIPPIKTRQHEMPTALYDLHNDPSQLNPIHDDESESRMIRLLVELMQKNDAPPEQYARLGLDNVALAPKQGIR